MSNPTTAESPWPVRVVAMKIADWIARLGEVWVEGQIAQLTRRPGTRTAFVVLRDPSADISINVTCPMTLLEGIALANGSHVVIRARPDYFVARGTLSLRALDMKALGVGELLARLERLKRALHAEGLFDPALKQRLPFLPRRVGLITGRASAAERDVLQTARRRWPAVEFQIENVAVQGPIAVSQVVPALARLANNPEVDVIIIARGGGSVEDLLPFSDEALCRAVAACPTPVISAIGHEPDTPLLDFVADVRCSTPTDAGKRVVPDFAEELSRLQNLRQRSRHAVTARLDREAHWLENILARPVLATPVQLLAVRQHDVHALRDRARRCLAHRLDGALDDVTHARARVISLSPAATLRRGYAIVQQVDNAVVRNVADVTEAESLNVTLGTGSMTVRVDERHIPAPEKNSS